MKPERAPTPAPPQPARVEFQVQFASPRSTRPRVPETSTPTEAMPLKKPRGRRWGVVPAGRPSKTALLLVMAHHWERLVQEGVVRDYADIARLTGLTRARVTQIMNLTLLAPELQEEVLAKRNAEECLCERNLRAVVTFSDWKSQQATSGAARAHAPRHEMTLRSDRDEDRGGLSSDASPEAPCDVYQKSSRQISGQCPNSIKVGFS